jgi:uncharacterized membrane protein YeaQ/YmgE (transglycosylase-associated protein family)
MEILSWVLFGFVVGLIARTLMPGRDAMGLLATTVLGIVGALLGGWLGQALGLYRSGDNIGFIGATIGAIVVLGVFNAINRRRTRRTGIGGRVTDKEKTDRAA